LALGVHPLDLGVVEDVFLLGRADDDLSASISSRSIPI